MMMIANFAEDELCVALIQSGFKKKKLREYSVPALFKAHDFAPELLPVCDKAGTTGVLILSTLDQVRAVSYELNKLKASKSGTLKPIICDFCYTLQSGTNIALISFSLNRDKTRTVSHFICGDLACSLHVRGLTNVLDIAKSQIREDITIEDRILRLISKSTKIFESNGSKII